MSPNDPLISDQSNRIIKIDDFPQLNNVNIGGKQMSLTSSQFFGRRLIENKAVLKQSKALRPND